MCFLCSYFDPAIVTGFFSYLNIQKNSSLNISLYTKSYSLKKYLNTIMKYSQSSTYLHFGFWDLVIFFPFLQRNNTYSIFCKLFAYLVKPNQIFCVGFENWQGPTVLYHLLPIIIYKNILAHILWMSNTDVVCVIVITIPLGGLCSCLQQAIVLALRYIPPPAASPHPNKSPLIQPPSPCLLPKTCSNSVTLLALLQFLLNFGKHETTKAADTDGRNYDFQK